MTDARYSRAVGPLRRREFLGVAGVAGLMLATGCSSKGSGDSAPKSVTVKHIFGETTIAAPPKRVVSAGFTEQDDLLAVGVVPVAVTNWFGDQPFGVWPWAQPRLGTSRPVVLNLDNGIQVDEIAELKPDLIVAVNAGLDADTYQKLTAIAPTIAQSGDDAFFDLLHRFANDDRFAYKLVSTADFERLVGEVTGSEVPWFFDLYLRRAAPPRWTMTRRPAAAGMETVDFAWDDPAFQLPLPVEVAGEGARVPMPGGRGTLEVAAGAEVAVDPDSRIFAELSNEG